MSGKWIASQRIPTRCARCSSLAQCRRSSRWGGICCRQSRQASTGSWFWSILQKKYHLCVPIKFFFLSPCIGPPQFRLKCNFEEKYFFIWSVAFLCFLLRQWVRWCRTAPTCSRRGTCSTAGWTGRGPARGKIHYTAGPWISPRLWQTTFEWNKLRHHWERPVVAGILPGESALCGVAFF